MDFDKVLREWEEGRPKRSRRRLEEWIDAYPPDREAQEDRSEGSLETPGERRRRVRLRAPERTLDLHGVRAGDATARVDGFLDQASRDGIEKVLIIHGKGKHSGDGEPGVLKRVVYDAIRRHPAAGEIGVPDRSLGGSGAVWVAVRYRSR